MDGISTGDLALMRDNNRGDWDGMWIFALLMLMFGGGNWGNNRGPVVLPPQPDAVTHAELTAGLNNQATQAQLQQLAIQTANNNYETARLIQNQTSDMQQQNNTNLINAIQGFNQVNLNIQNQTNVLSQQLQSLDAKMSACCCEIKTMMLENRLQDEQIKNATLRNDISNLQQSQYILGQMGRFVAWAGSGTQTASNP